MMTALSPRLLIVDDEAPVRDFLSDAAAEYCSCLLAVPDVKEAFRAIETGNYDVVLADICMPGCSGMDLLYLGVTAVAFLAFGAWSFRWRVE